MNEIFAIVILMAVAGILLGGAMSLRKNEKFIASGVCAVVAALAFIGGVAMIYG